MTFRQIVTNGLLVFGLGVAGLAAFGFVQLGGDGPPVAEQAATLLPVETVAVAPVSSFTKRRRFTGVLKAARTSELGFERTGRLIAVEVQEGERVEAGQVLARLDAENLLAKQQELAAQRTAAESLLREFVAGPRPQTIAAARAEVRGLDSQVELAELNYQRRERLLATRATSQEAFESASQGLKSIGAQRDAAQRRLDELEAGTRAERIDAQRAVVAQLDAGLANVAIDIQESTLQAPFAGLIGKRHLDEGTIVAAGAPLLRIVEDGQLEAWIGLPPQLASRLRPRQEVTVFVADNEHRATLTAILPELDPATRTRTAIFRLAAGGSLLPAQIARIELEDLTQAEGFWVPTTALTGASRGLWSVLVVEPAGAGEQATEVAVKREVEILHTDGQRVLVRGTLVRGDRVIVSGTHRIVAGQSVTTTQPMTQLP